MTLFDHKHVIKIIESFDDEKLNIIVMEALENACELIDVFTHYEQNWLDKGQPLIEEDMVRLIIKGICEGLSHIHEKGITHRDMKMENILIDMDERVLKIIDFGLS